MTEETIHEAPAEEGKNLTEMARKVMLATIGAVALAQEEAEAFIKKLIERGEIVPQDRVVVVNTGSAYKYM